MTALAIAKLDPPPPPGGNKLYNFIPDIVHVLNKSHFLRCFEQLQFVWLFMKYIFMLMRSIDSYSF